MQITWHHLWMEVSFSKERDVNICVYSVHVAKLTFVGK